MPDLLERLKSALSDRYGIEKEIGRGGMAVVFLAEDLKHHRKVAIKVLHPELAASLGADRFLREIKTVARLRHPHILPLYDSGAVDGLLYYVMPYVEGGSLRQRLDREGAIDGDADAASAPVVAPESVFRYRGQLHAGHRERDGEGRIHLGNGRMGANRRGLQLLAWTGAQGRT